MALQNLVGAGPWFPSMPEGVTADNVQAASDLCQIDADEEEVQLIGNVHVDGGTADGAKTFGTSGSKISWLPGASQAFVSAATLTIGIKKASVVDLTAGPVARATIGAAAFSVYKALIGGTDAITSTTWRDDAMASGTPFTVNDGDLVAICFHLDVVSGTQLIRVRQNLSINATKLPVVSLVTTGPTYTTQLNLINVLITFDDGTLGWIEPTQLFTVASNTVSATIGNGNIVANIFRRNTPCKIDALAANVIPADNTADFALELYGTPLGTPGLIESVACDANVTGSVGGGGMVFKHLTTPRTLLANTDYAMGIKQTTANIVTTFQRDVNDAAHFKPSGMGAECYAANSTAGGTFAAQNSGKRRYSVWARISALDDGVITPRARLAMGI